LRAVKNAGEKVATQAWLKAEGVCPGNSPEGADLVLVKEILVDLLRVQAHELADDLRPCSRQKKKG